MVLAFLFLFVFCQLCFGLLKMPQVGNQVFEISELIQTVIGILEAIRDHTKFI